MATAAQLMYDHSVAGTSLGDVQKAAGVGPSQVYHYFGDKESLIRAVISYRIHVLLATLGGLDSMEGLRAWGDFVVDTQRQRDCERRLPDRVPGLKTGRCFPGMSSRPRRRIRPVGSRDPQRPTGHERPGRSAPQGRPRPPGDRAAGRGRRRHPAGAGSPRPRPAGNSDR